MKKSGFDQIQTLSALCFGSIMLLLGVFIPLAVPANQQNEVLIMTFFFTLTGMLLLHSARPNLGRQQRILMFLGVFFALLGLVIPLMRRYSAPDIRFFWMMAYMPVLIGGLFFVEWPSASVKTQAKSVVAAPIRRSPATRMPNDMRYKRILPIALMIIFVLILIVVAMILIPALAVFLR